MKIVLKILFILLVIEVKAQDTDTVLHCNSKWMNELLETDSISKENKIQDYMCYLTLFDSLNTETKRPKIDFIQGVSKVYQFSDADLTDILCVMSFDYLFSEGDNFFKIINKQFNNDDYEVWAMMISYEYLMRSPEEDPTVEKLIVELKNKSINLHLESWKKFEKKLRSVWK